MSRALELAALGRQTVAPNPMVGCVIVHNNVIIGEGFHMRYGEAHAEVNAIRSVADHSLLKEATLYVTLEPCSHYGKTPPCANLIIQSGIPKVVICNADPNPLVSGRGVKLLRDAGIEVEENVMTLEGTSLNKRFFTFHTQKRPYIILKWAETKDGFIARENNDSKWISDEYSRMLTHKLRSEEAAIMVGTNTLIYDNPKLSNRDWAGKSPVRILVDRQLKSEGSNLNVYDASQNTVIYNQVKNVHEGSCIYIQIDFEKDIIPQILGDLYRRNITSLIIEGGAKMITSFVRLDLWDEAMVFVSKSITFDKGISAPELLSSYDEYQLIADNLRVYNNYSK